MKTMDQENFLISVKNDIGFHIFFADERRIEFLEGLLKSILKIADDEYEVIEILDPHLLQEFKGDKFSVIDVKVKTKHGKIVHIEIQLQVRPGMEERIIYYDAKLITEQIGDKEKYKDLKQVISIIITDETLIKSSTDYHHRFTFYDPNASVELSDLIEIHTLELHKLPEKFDGTDLCDWAKFIAAESEEELNMVSERNPQIRKAVVKLQELSADKKARSLYEQKKKARMDWEMHMDFAREEGIKVGLQAGEKKREQELINKMKCSGMSDADIERILAN